MNIHASCARASEWLAYFSLSAALLFYFLSFLFAISLFLLFRAAQLETARRGVPPAKINTRLRSSPRDSEFSDAVTTCARSSVSSQALRVPTVFIGVRGERRASRVENFCRTFLRRENLDRISWAKRESEDVGERRGRTSLNRRNPAFKKRNFGRGSPGPSLFPAARRDNLPAELRAGKNRRSRSKAGSGGSCNTRSLARTE